MDAAKRRVGGWAKKSFPKAALTTIKLLGSVFGLAFELVNIAYQALASDVACD